MRIVAPLPNRTTVGLEVPNDHRQTVRLKEIIQATTAKAAKFKLPIFLGKDVEGRPLVYDMAAMPHLLIAGRTGTGKSVCLNAIIHSFLLTRHPDECRLILIDPKKVEFSDYARIPHLMHPVVTDDRKAEAILGLGGGQDGGAVRTDAAGAGAEHRRVQRTATGRAAPKRVRPGIRPKSGTPSPADCRTSCW